MVCVCVCNTHTSVYVSFCILLYSPRTCSHVYKASDSWVVCRTDCWIKTGVNKSGTFNDGLADFSVTIASFFQKVA